MKDQLSEKQQFWLNHIEAALSSETSMNAYAKLHHLDVKSLYCWKSQFVKKGIIPAPKSSPFTKVKHTQPLNLAHTDKQLYVARLPNGIELRFERLNKDILQLISSL